MGEEERERGSGREERKSVSHREVCICLRTYTVCDDVAEARCYTAYIKLGNFLSNNENRLF